MPDVNLLSAAVESQSRAASSARLVNLYPEKSPDGTITLYGTPGLSLFTTAGNGPIRGITVAGSKAYVVSGATVYSVNTSGVCTSLGSISTSTGMVSMASNGIEIQITDGTVKGYVITLATDTLAAISDPDFPGGVTNGFLDGFTLFNEPNTGKLWATSIYAAGVIDPLDFATAEGAPDDLVAILVDHREIWLFGERTVEVWYNSGAAEFPFERINGAFIENGCDAAFSAAKMDNTVFWLGSDDKGAGIVWRADGYTPRRISTHEIENRIAGYATTSDAVAWTFQLGGHAFYVLTFPTGNETWAFDVSTETWHQWAYFDGNDFVRHRGSCHAFFAGKHIVGDHSTGALYELDADVYEDNGDTIARELISSHVRSGGRAFYSELEVRMETGVGLLSGQGSDPQITMATSSDG
jgi:hypothetical protein